MALTYSLETKSLEQTWTKLTNSKLNCTQITTHFKPYHMTITKFLLRSWQDGKWFWVWVYSRRSPVKYLTTIKEACAKY
jgi:hypothetical protein